MEITKTINCVYDNINRGSIDTTAACCSQRAFFTTDTRPLIFVWDYVSCCSECDVKGLLVCVCHVDVDEFALECLLRSQLDLFGREMS